MAFDAHANGVITAVAVAPVTPTAGTALTVSTGTGALFPAAPFNVVICPSSGMLPGNFEIVRVTNIVSDVLTIVRTQEGTSARTVLVGDALFLAPTAKTFTDIELGVAASWPILKSSLGLNSAVAGTVGTAATVNGTVYALPFLLPVGTLVKAAINVSTLAASSAVRFALVSPDATTQGPSTTLTPTDLGGTIDSSTTGRKSLTCSLSVPTAGLWWLLICAQGGAPVLSGYTNVGNSPFVMSGTPDLTRPGYSTAAGAVTSGALPAFVNGGASNICPAAVLFVS